MSTVNFVPEKCHTYLVNATGVPRWTPTLIAPASAVAGGNCQEILRTEEFRCSSAARPFNSPVRPPNSAVRQPRGIRIEYKWNHPLTRSSLASKGPNRRSFCCFPRETRKSGRRLWTMTEAGFSDKKHTQDESEAHSCASTEMFCVEPASPDRLPFRTTSLPLSANKPPLL